MHQINKIDFTDPKLLCNVLYTTTDYEALLYNNLKSNRELHMGHVRKLRGSFKEVGQMLPVLLSEMGILIDGHHRVIAAKEENLPVIFTLRNITDPALAQKSMNAVARVWKVTDYLHNGAVLNFPHYQTILTYLNTYAIVPGILDALSITQSLGPTAKHGQKIDFLLSEKEREYHLQIYSELDTTFKTVFGNKARMNIAFTRGLASILKITNTYPNWDWKVIISRIPRFTSLGNRPITLKEKQEAQILFESCYNYQKPKKDKIHNFTNED